MRKAGGVIDVGAVALVGLPKAMFISSAWRGQAWSRQTTAAHFRMQKIVFLGAFMWSLPFSLQKSSPISCLGQGLYPVYYTINRIEVKHPVLHTLKKVAEKYSKFHVIKSSLTASCKW